MGSKLGTDQLQDDSNKIGKYPIIVRVRVRVQLPMEQPHKLIIIIK